MKEEKFARRQEKVFPPVGQKLSLRSVRRGWSLAVSVQRGSDHDIPKKPVALG
jgi:hypothetical protein